MEYLTNSDAETKTIAAEIASKMTSGVIALTGEMGAGKTTFTQGFAKGLGIKDKIISPTFVLIRQHQIPQTKKTLYHLDLYRLEQVDSSTLSEIKELFNKDNIVLIEWAEKIIPFLPQNYIQINIENLGTNSRKITVLPSPV